MANSSPLNDFNTTSGIHRPLSLEYQTLGGEKKTEPKAFRAIANGEWSKPQWVGRLLNNRHEIPGSARENVAYVIPCCTCVPSASQKKKQAKRARKNKGNRTCRQTTQSTRAATCNKIEICLVEGGGRKSKEPEKKRKGTTE